MNPITYKLNIDGSAASTYYPAITAFTNEVLERAEESLMPIAKKYRLFLIGYNLEEPRTLEEYIYEFLNLGILWKAYGNTAMAVTFAPFRFMACLGEWRKTHPRWKPFIDIVRGFMLSFFLVPSSIRRTETAPQTLNELERLVTWLEATGDFREDAFRYIRWLGYLGAKQELYFRNVMDKIISFADWFEQESEKRMGKYTPNVSDFVNRSSSRYRWREDRFSCLRSRVEYHLNMVGAEIMNRAYRNDFVSCTNRTVLLPGCMRIRSVEECKGIKTLKGIRCTGCNTQCHVNQLREIGKRHHFEVMVIPHSTNLNLWSTKWGDSTLGVVGVACLSALVQGGWELKRNNIPAQCVPLNECGCKKHWHKDGFPTHLDVRELKRIVAV